MHRLEYGFIICRETDTQARDIGLFLHEMTSLEPSFLFESLDSQALIEHCVAPTEPRCVAIGLLARGNDIGDGSDTHLDQTSQPSTDVVFALGYFFALLPRTHVIVLADEGVHVPHEMNDVVLLSLDDGDWPGQLARVLQELGATID